MTTILNGILIENKAFTGNNASEIKSKINELITAYTKSPLPTNIDNLVDIWKTNAVEDLNIISAVAMHLALFKECVQSTSEVVKILTDSEEGPNIFDRLIAVAEKVLASQNNDSTNKIIMMPVAQAPTYIISAGKAEVKFPESNANLEQKVKDFFGSECMLKSLAAKLADGEYQFKVLSGDEKSTLRLLCCLPDKEILLSYKDDSCDVAVVEI